MTGQRPIRASDHNRESVAEVLRGAYAAGCLDRSELEQRSGEAYRARTLDELRALTDDLPMWLLERPVPPPRAHCSRRLAPTWRWGLVLAIAGFWLTAVALAWAPLATIPLALVWLLVVIRARGARPGARPAAAWWTGLFR